MNRLFLDVSTFDEYLSNPLEMSINIPHNQILNSLDSLAGYKEIIVYCKTGRRSSLITKVLKQLGYNAIDVKTVERAEDVKAWKN
jgi:rhodanese-related sulfurtransferase